MHISVDVKSRIVVDEFGCKYICVMSCQSTSDVLAVCMYTNTADVVLAGIHSAGDCADVVAKGRKAQKRLATD